MTRITEHRPIKPRQSHLRREQSKRKAQRKDRSMRLDSSDWAELRAAVLERDILCTHCFARKSVDVDHIDGNKNNTQPYNLQGLCRSCHSRKTSAVDGGFGNVKRTRRRALEPLHVVLLAGPPGSGKSRFAHNNFARSLIIDTAEITSRISGLQLYEARGEWIGEAKRERARLMTLFEKRMTLQASMTVIDLNPQWSKRRALIERFSKVKKCTVQSAVFAVEPAVCMERIRNDPSRSTVPLAHWQSLVFEWWSNYTTGNEDEEIIRS